MTTPSRFTRKRDTVVLTDTKFKNEDLKYIECMICKQTSDQMLQLSYFSNTNREKSNTIVHCMKCSKKAQIEKMTHLMRTNQFFFKRFSQVIPMDITIFSSDTPINICYGIPARWIDTLKQIVIVCQWTETTSIGNIKMFKSISLRDLMEQNPAIKEHWRKSGKLKLPLQYEKEFSKNFPLIFSKIKNYINEIDDLISLV